MGGGAHVGRGGGDHYHSDNGFFMMVSKMTKEMKKMQKTIMMMAMFVTSASETREYGTVGGRRRSRTHRMGAFLAPTSQIPDPRSQHSFDVHGGGEVG